MIELKNERNDIQHRAGNSPAGACSWIEVSEKNYLRNLQFIRSRIGPQVELASVVKSNAYGHGMLPIAHFAQKFGVRTFCVNSLPEAIHLRDIGIELDVLIMGHMTSEHCGEALRNGFRITVDSLETLKSVLCASTLHQKRALIHLKVDTGMHRQGIFAGQIRQAIEMIRESRLVAIDGVCTHLASSDETEGNDFLKDQLRHFADVVKLLSKLGVDRITRHAAASAGALWVAASRWDMVRIGLAQYGLWPSPAVAKKCEQENKMTAGSGLSPIATWKARIGQIKTVPKGGKIGYGCTFVAREEMRIAVVPVGYADGFDRGLSNCGHALIRGLRVPIVGRVCMNVLMLDVSSVPALNENDEIVLLGRQGEQEISADEIAQRIGTINYEVMSRLNADLPRVIVDPVTNDTGARPHPSSNTQG